MEDMDFEILSAQLYIHCEILGFLVARDALHTGLDSALGVLHNSLTNMVFDAAKRCADMTHADYDQRDIQKGTLRFEAMVTAEIDSVMARANWWRQRLSK